jgi:hypothetical protein
VLAATALSAAQLIGEEAASVTFIIRDSAGLMGLAAIGATVFGGRFAWSIPFAWSSIAFFIPPGEGLAVQVATWTLRPPGTVAATWTALGLAVAGTLTYVLAGPRR